MLFSVFVVVRILFSEISSYLKFLKMVVAMFVRGVLFFVSFC